MSKPNTHCISASMVAFTLFVASPSNAGDSRPDPTRPPTAQSAIVVDTKQSDLPMDLSAVFFKAGRSVAIINGERVRENDLIGSALVIAIRPDRVQLEQRGKNIELKLIQKDVKESRQ